MYKETSILTSIATDTKSMMDAIKQWFVDAGETCVDLRRIDKLLDVLEDGLTFVMESPYVDAHFRDCYYSCYSHKFNYCNRDAIRVHIFAGSVDGKNEKEQNEIYRGYFIVRPVSSHPLGRSFISPLALKRRDFVCCLMREDVYLLDYKLQVCGFPHVVQDELMQSCAESALWALTQYYGYKYSFYKTMLPSQIIKSLPVEGERHLPSHGLRETEIIGVLSSCGHKCLMYTRGEDESDFFPLLNIYIESGIPVILVLHGAKDGHAVVAIGHGVVASDGRKIAPCTDVSDIKDTLVLMDDNLPPYHVVNEDSSGSYFKDMNIAFIVPLHKHMFLEARVARKFVNDLLGHTLPAYSAGHNHLTRLLLTTGRAFKHSLGVDMVIDNEMRERLVRMSLPKFVWMCEIYKDVCYKDLCDVSCGKSVQCSGLVIIDATGDGRLSSILLYIMDDSRIVQNGVICKKKYRKLSVSFCKQVYRHNLIGEWKKWQI